MSVCTLIASDSPLTEAAPLREYPLEIKIDNGAVTINDGDTDDNYCLRIFPDVESYTGRKYGVCLDWHYTNGRAKQIVEYVKAALRETETVELWRVWLTDYYEFEDRPVIHRVTISMDELTVEHIKEINEAKIWNTPDKMYPDRPSFYCLSVTRP